MKLPFLPMLAVAGQPFDSPEYFYEVKWNGIRALAAKEADHWQLWGRDPGGLPRPLSRAGRTWAACRTARSSTASWCCESEGLPDLDALLSRHQLTSSFQVRLRSQQQPVDYVVFDVVRHAGRSLWGEPLRARRALLEELLERWQEPRVLLSTGVVGGGRRFFQRMVSQGHEGVMAKHLASRYLPGRRSAAWRKIKPIQTLCAVIIGYRPGRRGAGTFRSLLVAAPRQGRLTYVATLRAGFTAAARADLEPQLAGRQRRQPLVACPVAAVWVEPELYCAVRFLEWTRGGRLRGASFQRLLPAAGAAPAPSPTRPTSN